jgi:predicted transposase YdaD
MKMINTIYYDALKTGEKEGIQLGIQEGIQEGIQLERTKTKNKIKTLIQKGILPPNTIELIYNTK